MDASYILHVTPLSKLSLLFLLFLLSLLISHSATKTNETAAIHHHHLHHRCRRTDPVVGVWRSRGDPWLDGGNLSILATSGEDPLFFAHHANVDRMWELWRGLPGGNRSDFSDADWLDTEFLFWDENLQLVRIRVRDVLHVERLGYSYQNQTIPWLNATHTPVPLPTKKLTLAAGRKVVYPITLDSTVRVEVARPGGMRKDAGTEEVLVVDEIGVEMGADCRFDVYVSAVADHELITPAANKFAGRFRHMAMGAWQRDSGKGRTKRRLVLGLTDLLEDIGASGDESIFVTLVPRTKSGKVTVGSIRIRFSV